MGERLSDEQDAWLLSELGDFAILADLSWGSTPSGVWHVADAAGAEYVVKSSTSVMRHHVLREIAAHETAVPALAETGDAHHARPGMDAEWRNPVARVVSCAVTFPCAEHER